jgi:uncharacterized protein (TIGR01777 family)
MSEKRVILAGGSGVLGKALEPMFREKGYTPYILTRSPKSANHLAWDGKMLGDWAACLDGAVAVINLAGRSVDCRHTPKNRREIIDSRINSVNVLHEAILHAQTPPLVLIQAAAMGIYGNGGDNLYDENSPAGTDFLAQVAVEWEKAFFGVELPQTRKVLLRISLVLAKDEGVLQPMTAITRLFLGGATGSGRQYMSWIHIDDLCRLFLQAVEDTQLSGVYNACTPNPVRNAEFMRAMRQQLHRPWCPPAPEIFVRIGAWLMQSEGDLVLIGRKCVPKRLLEQGFTFQYPTLQSALNDLLGKAA